MKFWSRGTSSAVINTQLKFKERDKIISENSSLIPFVRYSEKKNNFVGVRTVRRYAFSIKGHQYVSIA